MSDCQPRAITIASSLVGGCDLSHERVKDGCEGTGVKFGAESPTELWIW